MNCPAVTETIVRWLKNYLLTNNQKGFVVGVSGGIDSALVSTLCSLTGKPVMLLTLPINQAADQVTRGFDHIKWLKAFDSKKLEGSHEPWYRAEISSRDVDLTKTFEAIKGTLDIAVQRDELAMANLQARLRMSTLYAYAGHLGYVVAGTGNKVEDFGVGFFTKWGDGAVDLSPIGDLSKSQVWELAEYLGILESIRKAKPTDGLWGDNRSDEDQIGASYAELEWAMGVCESDPFISEGFDQKCDSYGFVDNSLPYSQTVNYTKRQRDVLLIYMKRHLQSRHKFEPIPVCKIPKVIL